MATFFVGFVFSFLKEKATLDDFMAFSTSALPGLYIQNNPLSLWFKALLSFSSLSGDGNHSLCALKNLYKFAFQYSKAI
jgi:hypothetical protein